MNTRLIVLFACIFLLPFQQAFAHAEGQSFEEISDEYFVDIGFDTPFKQFEETLIDFGLFTLVSGEVGDLASYTNVTVRIQSGSTVLYERSIDKPEFGKAFATVTPTKSGNWLLTADFTLHDELLHSAAFSVLINATPSSENNSIAFAVLSIVMVIVFLCARTLMKLS